MDIDPKIERDGMQWLFAGGLAAVLLCCFLAYSDHYLSTSDAERRLGEKLRELRSAQASLPGNPIDERQLHTVAVGSGRGEIYPVELTEFEGFDTHASGHDSHGDSHSVAGH